MAAILPAGNTSSLNFCHAQNAVVPFFLIDYQFIRNHVLVKTVLILRQNNLEMEVHHLRLKKKDMMQAHHSNHVQNVAVNSVKGHLTCTKVSAVDISIKVRLAN